MNSIEASSISKSEVIFSLHNIMAHATTNIYFGSDGITIMTKFLMEISATDFKKVCGLPSGSQVGRKGDQNIRTPLIKDFFDFVHGEINDLAHTVLKDKSNNAKSTFLKNNQVKKLPEPQIESIKGISMETGDARKHLVQFVTAFLFSQIQNKKLKTMKEIQSFCETAVPMSLWCFVQGSKTNIFEYNPPQLSEEAEPFKNPVGSPRLMPVPPELRNKISFELIPKYSCEDEKPITNTLFTRDVLLPIMQHILFPLSSDDIRPSRIWKVNNIRIINYAATAIIYGRFHDHPDFPTDLKMRNPIEDFPPPWHTIVDFFDRFNLPGLSKKEIEKMKKGKSKENNPEVSVSRGLMLLIVNEYIDLIDQLLSEASFAYAKKNRQLTLDNTTRETAPLDSPPKKYLKHMDCLIPIQTRRPPKYNDLQDIVYKFRHCIQFGCFDEFPLLEESEEDISTRTFFATKSINTLENQEHLQSLGKQGFHHNESAIIEVVFNARINSRRPVTR